jgi:hypothetical protein
MHAPRRCWIYSAVGLFLASIFESSGAFSFDNSHVYLLSKKKIARRSFGQLIPLRAASHSGDERDMSRSIAPLNMSPIEDERRPRRLMSSIVDRPDYRNEWGVSRDKPQDFPDTAQAVVEQAFLAIAGTIYKTHRLDPRIASNAVSRSIFDHRPTRKERDAGRMGIEIDGAQHLFPNNKLSSERATRRLSLMLAAKLSVNSSWKDYEDDNEVARNSKAPKAPSHRPVVVYFTTINEALMASQELKLLRLDESKTKTKKTAYNKVKIQCLGDDIPKSMCLDPSERRRYRGLSDGHVNATQGIIIISTPTDYNSEYIPPGPVIGTVAAFQRLVAQASIQELPTIAVSPRFLSNDTPFYGLDQSGYQQSSAYGGIEPPKGPTPWVMRDFTPPLFCWVGNALSLSVPRHRGIEHADEVSCCLSRVALTQSIMDDDHAWHLFSATECHHGSVRLPTSYGYLASTRSANGRPTKDLIKKILNGM